MSDRVRAHEIYADEVDVHGGYKAKIRDKEARANLKDYSEKTDERLNGVDDRIDGVDDRIDGVDDRIDGIDDRIDGVDDDIENLDGRLDTAESAIANMWSTIYPVGSIYMSVNSTSPASLFGGTWEQIQDMFLLAAGQTYVAGDTGGEATHTLLATEMPSHRHWISAGLYDDGNMSTTGNSNTQDNGLAADAGSYSENDTCKTYGRYSAWAGGEAGENGKGTGGSASVTSAHNNMPPYLAVYVWKRVADV